MDFYLRFGNIYCIKVMVKFDSIIYQAKLLERPGGKKKNRTVLKKLGLMVWPNNI